MSEKFEQLRQKALEAKAEQGQQVQLSAEKSREESKAEILRELEQGHQRLGELALLEAETSAKISQLFQEIRTAEREVKKILEETIPAAEQDEAFLEQEELRAEAIGVLQEEAKMFEDSILTKRAELEEAKRQHDEVSTEMRDLLEREKAYLGEREIPELRMTEIWEWVEQERKIRDSLNRYRNHAVAEVSDFAYKASDEQAGDEVTYTFEEGHVYLQGTPKEIFTNPRFYNEYIDGFKDGLNKFLQEERGWRWRDEKLSPEKIEQIKQTAFRLAYRDKKYPKKDKEVVVYGGMNPVTHMDVPEDKFFTSLTPGEQKIIEEAITSYENREDLEKRLRRSEYRADVHEAIVEQERIENEEHNSKTLAEKSPELQAELDKTLNELKGCEAKLVSSKEVEDLFRQVSKILESLSFKTRSLEGLELQAKDAEEKVGKLQIRREALPKRFFSKKPKDEEEDNRLAREIERHQERQTSAERSVSSYKREIEQAEQSFTAIAERLEIFRDGMRELLNKVRSSESSHDKDEFRLEFQKVEREVLLTDSQHHRLKEKLKKLEWIKEQWEGGKHLASSLAEMLAK